MFFPPDWGFTICLFQGPYQMLPRWVNVDLGTKTVNGWFDVPQNHQSPHQRPLQRINTFII